MQGGPHTSQHTLIRVLASQLDLGQALSAVSFLLEEVSWQRKYKRPEMRRFKCYETTAVIAFCRPFVSSRGKTTLSLKQLGLRLTDEERSLHERLMTLRKKVMAHSDEDWMHFRLDLIDIGDDEISFPHLQGDERLTLNESDLLELDALIRKITRGIASFVIHLARDHPEMVAMYKRPSSQP